MGCSFSSDVINKNDLEIINKSKEKQLLLEKQQSAKSRYSGWRKEGSLYSIYSNAGDVLDIVEEQEEEDEICEINNNSEAPLIEIDNSTVITVEESKVIEHHSTTLTVNHYNNRRQSIFCDEPLYLLENNLNSSFASSLKEKTIQTIDIDNKNITQ
ncbi:hypothetical protein ABK040_006146 [Willaertia magna]